MSVTDSQRVVVAGGGAAGFFAAITCAETRPGTDITVLEQGSHFLAKVRISGGGRCNVTHSCLDPRELSAAYPRGSRALIGPFQQFQAGDTIAWFERRGVRLKMERDGRIFPVSDSSQTIVDCLLRAAADAGVKLHTGTGVESVERHADGGFKLTLTDGRTPACGRLLLATGGCRTESAGRLVTSLGHTLEPPVPSLFTFHLDEPWLRELAGVSVEAAEVAIPGTRLKQSGALLVTHRGLSGPVILRLSAWGARLLHQLDYRFPIHVNWLPHLREADIADHLDSCRLLQPARMIVNSPIPPIPARLWEKLVTVAGVDRETRWAGLSRPERHRLIQSLTRTALQVSGKSLNKEEFVTCGGVRLAEVDFKTMQSRICPGLYFAGELLDIDGLTGGFNFQSAWTTGWLAGRALSRL